MYGAPDVDAGAETGSGAPLYGLADSSAALYGAPAFEGGMDEGGAVDATAADSAPTDAGSDADQ
jgi:hypothetical protein